MNSPPRLILTSLCLLLAHCSTSAPPYTTEREAWRADVREFERDLQQSTYRRGIEDGRMDFSNGESNNYRRHIARYDSQTEKAYADGYATGYMGGGIAPVRDAAYNQGFDYGMRDRTRGKPADLDAHFGEYDARFRESFERGYLDGYNR